MEHGHDKGTAWHISERKKSFACVAEEEDRTTWSPSRQVVARIVESHIFEASMGFLIVFSLVLIVLEADAVAACGKRHGGACGPPGAVSILNRAVLGIYAVEAGLRIYAYRSQFVCNAWNNLDLVIVMTGLMELILSSGGIVFPSVQVFRAFRILRLLRAVRLVAVCPELLKFFQGLACAMKAMFWGVMMIMLMLAVWSLLTVEIVNARSKPEDFSEHCGEAFSSVLKSTHFFFQVIVAGEGWSDCITPLIEAYPEYFFIFGGAIVSMQLGFMNLILTVIVQEVASARDKDHELQLKEKKAHEKECFQKFQGVISELDQDKSGTVTKEELMDGFRTQTDIRSILTLLDIDKGDLERFFDLMDADSSGEVSYKEFIDCLQKAHSQDMRTALFNLRLQVSQISGGVQRQVKSIEEDLQRLEKKAPRDQLVEQTLARELASERDVIRGGLQQLESRLAEISQGLLMKTATLSRNTESLEAALRRLDLDGEARARAAFTDSPPKRRSLGECSRSRADGTHLAGGVMRLADYTRRRSNWSSGIADMPEWQTVGLAPVQGLWEPRFE